MKRFKTKIVLVKSLALATVLASCNHNESIIPASKVEHIVDDQNAKTNAALKLVKYGESNVQYVKSGKFIGLISRLSSTTAYHKYTYNDNNGTTNIFITRESFSQATNNKAGETIYEVANGRCISAKSSSGASYEYKYNANGLLGEVNMLYLNYTTTFTYSYIFNAATNSYRLDKVSVSNSSGPVQETTFTYTTTTDKHHLNLENDNMDPLLPFFGTFSDVLVKDIEIKSTSGMAWSNFKEFTYVMDNNGNPASRVQVYHPLGKASNQSVSTSTTDYKYSQYWQGI